MTSGDDRPDLGDGRVAGIGAQSEPDLLSSSADEPRAEERLRQAFERSGALTWLRRHRLLLGGLAGLLVVVAAGAAYL